MVITKFRTDLPDWVREHMAMTCPECGAYIMDNSDVGGTTTARWCCNPKCPGHMAYKIIDVCKFLNIKGIGEKTANTMATANKFETVFDYIPLLTSDRPKATLADIAVLLNIDGYGATTAQKELTQFASFEQYFAQPGLKINPLLYEHKEELIRGQKFFEIPKPLSACKVNIMMTGAFNGWSSRDAFLRDLNETYGHYVHVINVGKRKTNVDFLVKEIDAPDHTKTQMAVDAGIPIITPSQLVSYVREVVSYIDNEVLLQSEGGANNENI